MQLYGVHLEERCNIYNRHWICYVEGESEFVMCCTPRYSISLFTDSRSVLLNTNTIQVRLQIMIYYDKIVKKIIIETIFLIKNLHIWYIFLIPYKGPSDSL